jgi:hypothetical protein
LVRIINSPRDEPEHNPGAEVFALQQDFQARLADETLRYLRSLRGLLGPASPGTFVRPQPGLVLQGEGGTGDVAEIGFEVENQQQVHVIATPMLTPLVRADGTTWFPEAVAVPASTLVAPGAVGQLRVLVNVPAQADPGRYDGALVLLGIKGAAVQVSFTIKPTPPRGRRQRVEDVPREPSPPPAKAQTAAAAKAAPSRPVTAAKSPKPPEKGKPPETRATVRKTGGAKKVAQNRLGTRTSAPAGSGRAAHARSGRARPSRQAPA